MAVLEELEAELATETRPALPGMVGGVSRGAVGRRRKKKKNALDEVTEEIAAEPESERPVGVLEQVKLETEADPENVRRMRAEGKRLTDEQQKIAFKAERERPLTDVLIGAAKAYYPAVWNTIGQLAKGTAKFAVEGVGKPLGNAVLSGLMYEPGSDEQEKAMRDSLGGAYNATRSLASGVAQDIEETSNAAIRAGMFGTSITDLAAEKSGLITEEQAFNNYLSREGMRRGEAEDAQAYPDRASTLLARNPLAGAVINSANIFSGRGDLTPEAKQAAVKDFEQTMLQQASEFKPDEDLSLLGEVLSPVGLPSRAVMPLTSALGGAMEATGGAVVRGVTKPTIGGVNPLEGVGIGIRKIGEGADAAGAKFSEIITGRPDTFLASPAAVVSAFTKRPGQLVEGSGKFLRDVGRQIDEGGIRGRTGIIERLGRDPDSSAWVQDLFGAGSQKRLDNLARKNKKRIEAGKEAYKPGRGGIMRAKTADYGLRMANSLSKTGVSGSVLNGILGAADIETAEEFGRSTGVGFGIGTYMGARVPERIGAVLDPTLDLRSKIDRVVETDPLDRRLDEEADLKRFRATADPKLVQRAEMIASPDELIASQLKELDGLFQLKAESEYAEEDTTELDGRITSMVDGINQLREQTKNLSQADLDERRRMVELDIADNLDVLRSNHSVAGLNNVDVNLLRGDEMAGWLRDKWGQTLERAEAVVGQFDGAADLSDAENQTLMLARQTINAFNAELSAFTGSPTKAPVRGGAFDPREKVEPHLVRAGVTVPTIVINADTAMKDPRGFRHSMLHEGNHALRQFQEVREMQQPMYEFLFGRKAGIPDDAGNRQQITPGIITDELIDNVLTPLYFGGAPTMEFKNVEARREYIRDEVMSEVSGISEGGARTIREVLDSPGQAVVDRLLISRQNSILGRLRAALELAGVELDPLGNVKSVLFGQSVSNASMPEVLAMMRQFKRQQLEYTDTMVFASKEMRENVKISVTELMTNRALQEAYKDDVNWVHEVVLDVRDENGDSVVQISLPEDSVMNAAVGEYRIVNGQLVDENGTVLPLDSSVNLTGLPDNSKASVENRIARNVDGSPKIIQQKEIEARARQRDQMIKDAIDNAPDDGSPTRLRDSGEGYYVGIPSPSQLSAIRELPNTLVTPYVKKNLLAFIEVLQKRDGSRILMEYQPALKKGKYRALSPKIRDVVPIGFRFTKAGNWLAVNVSVSRMFDKLDLWARNKPENLDLWGRSPAKFMDDVLKVLDNHNKNLAGQTNLDIDPDIALQKKNRVNDFFNMFTKDTEAANPSRTKLKARRGQESADRILMSARIDRINQMQISNAQKFPVDYGKMKINFLPGQPNGELRLDPSDDLEVENDLGFDVGPGARFLPGIRYTSLPDDPKKIMADFYLLNAMLTTLPTGWSMGKSYLGGSKGGEDTMFSPVADPTGRYAGVRAEKYQDALDEAKQTLIPALHSKIQKAIYFAIGAEFRHIYDQVRTDTIPKDLVDSPFFQEYAKGLAIQGSSLFGLKKDPAPRRYKDENKGYLTSYVAMENARKKLGMSIADVARFAERMYREPKWNSSYGGDKWGDIAAHLAKMSDPSYSTERVRAVVTGEDGRLQIVETDEFRDPGAYEEMFKEIDRGYDLQHNTNTVFNKIQKYSLGSQGYGWIAKMLDFKANVANPRELRGFVSGTMGKLADAWFADMRADAPLTQDLEAKVIEQLPESFTQNMDPAQFLEILKDTVGEHYRKSSSDPFAKIANEAEGIFRKNGGTDKEWKAIKKDQNAHIGLLLDDNFGDLGVARTDAVKLFRMLLNEGKDPRVTGKSATRTPLNVPKPPTPAPSGTAISSEPLFMLSPQKIKESADKIVAVWGTQAMGGSFVDILGHRFYLAATSTNPGFADLTVRKKYPGESTYGPPQIIKTVLMSKSSAKQVADAIQEFQDWLGTAPAEYSKSGGAAKTPSGQYFIGGKTFVPNQNQSAPTNLNKFVETLLGSSSFNGLKLGNVTILNAGLPKIGVFGLKVYQGDSVKDQDLLSQVEFDSKTGKISELKRDIADWLSDYGMMKASETGYTSLMGWMAQDLSGAVKPRMPMPSKKVSDLIAVLPATPQARVNQLIADLQDLEWVDANLANLPPSDIDASAEFMESLLLKNSTGLAKVEIMNALGPNDIVTLGKYLYDVGKWASDKLEKRKSADMVEEEGLTPDSPAAGYPKSDGTLKTIAEVAAAVGPYEAGSNENHVYFTSSSGTAVTNPYEDDSGEAIVLPHEIAKDADSAKSQIMNFWSYHMIGPSVSETALAIFDAANPGHLYSKEGQIMPADESVAMAKNEVAAQKQAMEFLKDMLLEDPIELGGNTWELAVVEEDNDGNVMGAVVKLNGVVVSNTIPVDPETASIAIGPKGIYDEYFAMDWMKDWKAPAESGSLLTPDQDLMMQAASQLVAAVAAGFVAKPEVAIINKIFSAEVNKQGNMVVTGYDDNGNVTGAIPIQGSKTMDPIDLEAAVYEALDLLNANAAPTLKTETPKITPQAINEAAEALLNDETTTLGKYTFEPIASGLGGTKVNIYVEAEGGDAFVEGGEQNPISDFLLDPGEYREPSDMLDAFHDKITEFLENNPDLEEGTGGPGPGARFMPAAIEGTFYHGTKRKDPFNKRRGRRPIYGSEGEEVTFLSPSYILATDFGPNVFQGILKDENIFDPTDPKDLKKVYKTADESELFQEVLEDGPDAMIEKIKHAGLNKDMGWETIEPYADVIKEAGFNGFVAYEGQIPAVGVFPDRIDVTKFSQMGFVRNSMDLPQGGVGSLGKGTIYPDVYPRTQAEMLTDLNPPEPEPPSKFDISPSYRKPLKTPIAIKNARAKRSDLLQIFPSDPSLGTTSRVQIGKEKAGEVYLQAAGVGSEKILTVEVEGDFAAYEILLPGEIVTDGSNLSSLVRQVNKIIEPFRKPTTGNAMVSGEFGGLLTREGGPPADFAKIQKTAAKFMPGITPKTLYNFYHLATLESQGRIKSEYGQGLMREYLNIYKQKYLETLAPLVSDQIKKYIGRGRVDEGVTDDVLEAAANDPVALDELMRQTYRSDMKRRNDVWNNITEHLKGLAAAGTTRDIIFRIDRLNNAIHNTNELLFSKFKNAGELMDAFEAINDARDERAYGRMVDKDLRDIEEFEGGPGARFMPAWSADQLAERPEITAVPEEFDERPLRPRFVYRLESIEDDPRQHELTDADGFTFFTTSPESAAALALNFAYDGYRPTSENFSVYRYRLPENVDIQRDHTLLNLDKMESSQERISAVRNAHEAMGLPLDAYRYVPAGEVAGTSGKRIDFPENPDLMKIYRAIRRGGTTGGVQFMPGDQAMPGSSQVDQSLAGVTGPDADQGPLSGARFAEYQQNLDRSKARLPKISTKITVNSDESESLKIFDESGKEAGEAKFFTDVDTGAIQVFSTVVRPAFLKKGYGEMLYREIAKHAQLVGVDLIVGDSVTPDAANVRKKLFPEDRSASSWSEWGDPMISQVPSAARFMPGARRKKQKEIEYVRPRTFGGPFVEIDGTEPNLDSSTRLDMKDAAMVRKPKNRKAPSTNLVGYPMAAAILVDGKIYSGVNHLDAVFRAANNGAFGDQFKDVWETHFDFSDDFYDADSDFNVVWNKMANRPAKKGGSQIFVDGFVTDKGYYVSRYVATKLERKNPFSEFYESGEDELHGGHLSGHFMPGYNPRYTDNDGNFDREAWLNDRRRAEAELRRRGVYKSDLSEEDYENEVRALLREMR